VRLGRQPGVHTWAERGEAQATTGRGDFFVRHNKGGQESTRKEAWVEDFEALRHCHPVSHKMFTLLTHLVEARVDATGQVLEADLLEVGHEELRLVPLALAVLHGPPTQGLVQLHRLVRRHPGFVL